MKRIILFFILVFPVLLMAQETNEQLWEKANSFYITEEYQQAILVYEQILGSGEESAKLYFNLGNAYFKNGNINNAILNYERAKILAPHDEDIDFNILFANQFVVTSAEALPKPFFLRWKDSVINSYPADTWSMLSISAFILFLAFLGFYLFGKNISLRKISFWAGIAFIIFSGFSYSFAGEQKKKIETRNQAIIFCPRVTVKSAPSETGTDLFLLYEGLKVEITDSLSNWREIKLSDGNKGWLPETCIVVI
jgi:tetratricopeptide (TPR) repeat protein